MSTPPDSFSDEQHPHEQPQDAEQGPSDEQLAVETPGEEQPPSEESALPPEAQGETNGGPLGCCLGTIAGIFWIREF